MSLRKVFTSVVALTSAIAVTFAGPAAALACGCFSPPVPPPPNPEDPVVTEYAVNQQAEVILFEENANGSISAHISIRYEGKPESFAWLLPVVGAPMLELSSDALVSTVEALTRPSITATTESLCPLPAYQCVSDPFCGGGGGGGGGGGLGCGGAASAGIPGGGDFFAGGSSTAGGGLASTAGPVPTDPPGVMVIDRQVVGNYETVTFSSEEAEAAVAWLQDNGFIVNDTTAPYMMPYLSMGMNFVAARLVPGADSSSIRPLKVTYTGAPPMIPLQLTAVAAEPEMSVTAIVFGQTPYEPEDQPMTTLDEDDLAAGPDGRLNYPMLLSRAIDEAGGDAFVLEFGGQALDPSAARSPRCTGGTWEARLTNDGVCQCPLEEFDALDCGLDETDEPEDPENPDAPSPTATLDAEISRLATDYAFVTRLTTRLSPHEMTFDPCFIPAEDASHAPLVLAGTSYQMDGCEDLAPDQVLYGALRDTRACATVYCGPGLCALDEGGEAGCVCDPGHVARTFTDLDGRASITCVPIENPVDFAAGGVALPDACEGIVCGAGTCVDRGGFPACDCDDGAVAIGDADGAITCVDAARIATHPGARDASDGFAQFELCRPAPSFDECGDFGHYERYAPLGPDGIVCATSHPPAAWQEARTCDPPAEDGCAAGPVSRGPAPTLFLIGLALSFAFARSRRHA